MAKNKESFPNYKDRDYLPFPIPNSESHILSIKKLLSKQPSLKKEDQIEMQLELPSQIENENNKMIKHEERMIDIRAKLSQSKALENNQIKEFELPKDFKKEINLDKHEERMQKIRGLLKK